MKLSRTTLVLTLLTIAIVVAGAVWTFATAYARPSRPEYPDAPFHRVGADYPRILPVQEWPSNQDRAAQSKYQAEQAKIRKYLREDGAVSRATPDERAAHQEMLTALQKRADGFVKVRELAGKVLDADPQSAIGHYVMAQVEHYGETNLPRALFEIRQARRLLEIRGEANPDDADAREWYILVLNEEYHILSAMDRREEQLRVVDLLEQVYQPMPWLRIFPLIKQHKADEAERCIEAIEKDGHWPLQAVNSRLMLAEQRRDRNGVYQAGKDMVQKIPDSGVLWSNWGEACINDFRLDEAEKAYLQSTRVYYDFNNSAHFYLSALALQKGKMTEAWQAVKQGQIQRSSRRPHTLQQDQSTADRAAALVLVALGRGEEAERFARRAFERPGRVGSTTFQEESEQFASGLLLWQALETRIEQLRENNSSYDVTTEWKLAGLRSESWTLKQKLVKLLSDDVFLSETLRPYVPGLVKLESWQLGSVLELLPNGVAEEGVARARQAESHPAAVAYFDAMSAELALRQGRAEEALTLVRKALEALPADGEKLLRGRVAAVGAEAARRLGKNDEARPLLVQALRDFPQALRMLDQRLPVRIEDDGSPLARETATQLARSARFRLEKDGFLVQVHRTGDQLTLALYRGENDCHVQIEVAAGDDLGKAAAAASARFHERIMSPSVDLTTVDINSVELLSRSK